MVEQTCSQLATNTQRRWCNHWRMHGTGGGGCGILDLHAKKSSEHPVQKADPRCLAKQ